MQQRRRHSRLILGLLALGLLAGAALTAPPAQAQVAGPYYAEPSWDQQIAPIERFVVLTNWRDLAVLDKETGLVWERSPNPFVRNWENALNMCLNKSVGGRLGWRLPSVVELSSLIDRSVSPGPALPVGHPFVGVLFNGYWSATTNVDSLTFARLVNVGNGLVGGAIKTDSLQVWCVRGGMNADQY